jgi:HAD superfamily hydrolase (TIGR01459 family)
MHAAPPPVLSGIAPLVPDRDLILCDVWGVVHNGAAPYPEAVDALLRVREAGKTVILISNAPRPGDVVARQIAKIGVPAECYDTVITSGDVTRNVLATQPGTRLYHLGPPRDFPNYDGLDLSLVEIEDAELIVCTGLFDDTRETPDDYIELLHYAQARGLPMLCANPDIVVERGDTHVWCAGALAESYASIGGDVLYAGKPYDAIYDTALAWAERARGARVAPEHVLAVGDGVRTDLAGASRQGFDCLFVMGGIHAAEFDAASEHEPDPGRYARVFAEAGAWPAAIIWRLVW